VTLENREGFEMSGASNPSRDLYNAVKSGEDVEVVETLLMNNDHPSVVIDINFVANDDYHGWTPLDWAIAARNYAIVELLIKHGANINVEDKSGETPLLRAVKNGHLNLVLLLIQHGGRVNVQDHLGGSPLAYAIQKRNTELVQLLIHNEAHVDAQDRWGETPLAWASEKLGYCSS
jgi:ankyrin repeat protein